MAGPGVLCCVVPGRREGGAGLDPWGGFWDLGSGGESLPYPSLSFAGGLCAHPQSPRRVQGSGRIGEGPGEFREGSLELDPPKKTDDLETVTPWQDKGDGREVAYGHRGAVEWGKSGFRSWGVQRAKLSQASGPPLPEHLNVASGPGLAQRGTDVLGPASPWAGPKPAWAVLLHLLGSLQKGRETSAPRNPPPANPPPQMFFANSGVGSKLQLASPGLLLF